MTKHSSRLKISYFISSSSELVLRNKIRFVVMLIIDLSIIFLVIVSSRKYFFSSPFGYFIEISGPSGYCFRFSW